jgi:hypothetical protein
VATQFPVPSAFRSTRFDSSDEVSHVGEAEERTTVLLEARESAGVAMITEIVAVETSDEMARSRTPQGDE